MKKLYWLTISLSLGLVNCQNSPPLPPDATNCAAVVQNYLGIADPIDVTNYIEQSSTQQIDIEYQSQNDENIPVTGTASCQFSGSDAEGNYSLTAATINDQPLTTTDISSLNQQVKFAQ
jgi:hypothetical protein